VPLVQCPYTFGGNLEFCLVVGDGSPSLRERNRGIFNMHQLILADGDCRWDVLPTDEIIASPCMRNTRVAVSFIAQSGFKTRLGISEATSQLSGQPG